MTLAVLFTTVLLATHIHPPYEVGECFRATAVPDPVTGVPPHPELVAQNGLYLAERIISIPDSSYPPSNGDPGCSTMMSKMPAAKFSFWLWVTCTTPAPMMPQAVGTVKIEVEDCPQGPDIFADGFESGDTGVWSSVLQG